MEKERRTKGVIAEFILHKLLLCHLRPVGRNVDKRNNTGEGYLATEKCGIKAAGTVID